MPPWTMLCSHAYVNMRYTSAPVFVQAQLFCAMVASQAVSPCDVGSRYRGPGADRGFPQGCWRSGVLIRDL